MPLHWPSSLVRRTAGATFGHPSMRVAGFLLAATAVCGAVAKIDDVVIRGDDRASFSIESFGFLPGGKASLSVKNFEVRPVARRA